MLTLQVLDNPSPYTISMAMRVTREIARDMFTDDSGSTYEREIFGTRYVYDTAARTLTSYINGAEL